VGGVWVGGSGEAGSTRGTRVGGGNGDGERVRGCGGEGHTHGLRGWEGTGDRRRQDGRGRVKKTREQPLCCSSKHHPRRA
jgi:hypothetical protein